MIKNKLKYLDDIKFRKDQQISLPLALIYVPTIGISIKKYLININRLLQCNQHTKRQHLKNISNIQSRTGI